MVDKNLGMFIFHFQFDRHRQPAEQHVRVQGVQEQDPNISGQTSLRRKAPLPRTHGHEHRTQNDGHLRKLVLLKITFNFL